MFGKSKKSKGRRTAGRGASRTRRKDSGGRTAVRGRKKAAGQGSGRGRFFTRWQAVAVAAVLVAFLGWMAWRSDYVQMRFVYMWPYQREIVTYSQKNRVDPFLVAAVIKNESRFKPGAVSGVGAIGLMQIMPDTGGWIAKQMGLKNYELQSLYNPETNIRMGCWYLSELHHEFKGNLILLMIAYNAGRGNTHAWMAANGWDYDFGDIARIPYADTRHYVAKVMQDRDEYYRLYKDKISQ